jgi:hypothetical protein
MYCCGCDLWVLTQQQAAAATTAATSVGAAGGGGRPTATGRPEPGPGPEQRTDPEQRTAPGPASMGSAAPPSRGALGPGPGPGETSMPSEGPRLDQRMRTALPQPGVHGHAVATAMASPEAVPAAATIAAAPVVQRLAAAMLSQLSDIATLLDSTRLPSDVNGDADGVAVQAAKIETLIRLAQSAMTLLDKVKM